jgi:hypothetical protein
MPFTIPFTVWMTIWSNGMPMAQTPRYCRMTSWWSRSSAAGA